MPGTNRIDGRMEEGSGKREMNIKDCGNIYKTRIQKHLSKTRESEG